ncbi:ExbD/TolR family protein [Rhizobium sp. PAMB 3182]
MISIARKRQKREVESTIALINVVFLMLIFFLIAGTLAPPLDTGLSMIETEQSSPSPPPDALVVLEDGSLRFRGQPVTAAAYVEMRRQNEDADDGTYRLVADRRLPATQMLEVVAALQEAGAERIELVTERAAK